MLMCFMYVAAQAKVRNLYKRYICLGSYFDAHFLSRLSLRLSTDA